MELLGKFSKIYCFYTLMMNYLKNSNPMYNIIKIKILNNKCDQKGKRSVH